MVKPMHMSTEIPHIIEADSGRPISVLEDDLQPVLRHLKRAVCQRVSDVLSESVFALLGASGTEDVAEWPERRYFRDVV